MLSTSHLTTLPWFPSIKTQILPIVVNVTIACCMTRREKESQKATEQRSLSVVSPKKAQAQVHTHAHAIQQEPHDRTTTRRYARTQVQNTYKVNGINQRPMIQDKGKGEYGHDNVQENGRQALG